MTSKEFVLWLKGFTEGVHEFNITSKQWDVLKDKLAEVKDEPILTLPIHTPPTPGITSIGTTSTTYGYPSGSAWNYTSTQQEPTPPKSVKQLLTENHD